MRDGDLGRRLLDETGQAYERTRKHRKEVEMLIHEKERRLLRDYWLTGGIWLVMVFLSTALLVSAGVPSGELAGIWKGIQACFWFLFGAVFLLRHMMTRTRIELLKEMKGLELRVLELQEKLGEREARG